MALTELLKFEEAISSYKAAYKVEKDVTISNEIDSV